MLQSELKGTQTFHLSHDMTCLVENRLVCLGWGEDDDPSILYLTSPRI